MKLAIEHIEVSLKAGERELAEARDGLKAAERNCAEQTERVAKLMQRNHEITQALTALRAAALAAQMVPVEKPVEKAAVEKVADRPNGKLSVRPRPEPAALKISDAR